jgi:ankyrin repeat protein
LTQYLIDIGADINATIRIGHGERTPLRLAVDVGQITIVDLLLDHGANAHAVCQGSLDLAETLACCEDHEADQFSFLESSQRFNDKTNATALQAAAARGHIEMIISLLGAGSYIDEPSHGNNGQTALHAATSAEFINVVELLLQRGATVDAPGTSSLEYPRTSLLTAVERNSLTLVEILLNYGANPNAPAFSLNGTTALEAARAQKDSGRLVSFLLAAGASDAIEYNDPVRIRYMRVQLVEAIINGNVETIRHLVNMGAEIDLEPIEYHA